MCCHFSLLTWPQSHQHLALSEGYIFYNFISVFLFNVEVFT